MSRARLLNAGEEIMRGDRKTIAVVYRNLRGCGWHDRPKEHAAYVEDMERRFDFKLAPMTLNFEGLDDA